MKIRNLLIAHFIGTTKLLVPGYIIVYIISTFVNWEFKNPFQWIIDLPQYDTEIRLTIIFVFITFHLSYAALTHMKKDYESVKNLHNENK